ncbi:MAG: hypothetical protein AAGF57_02255 [Pseudomonadota bacterium]
MSNEFLSAVEYPHPFDDLAVELCASAAREICILSPRLDHQVFDRVEIVDAIAGLVRSSRQTRIRILIADSRSVVARGHRLLLLARRLPTSVHIRKQEEHPQWKGETIVICDRDGVLYKPGDSDHNGFFEPSSKASTQAHLELFNELWRHSVEDIELRSFSL